MMAAHDFAIRWGMVIDLDKCTGCGACVVACQAENNVRIETDASDKLRAVSWMTVYRLTNGRPFPEHDSAYLPRPCMQCGRPACSLVCPATATTKDEEGGIVSQIHPRCFGCRYCMAACPFHARYYNWSDPVWPEGMEKTLNPDVSVRPRGVVEKCHFCHHRLMRAKDQALVQGKDPSDLPEDAYVPACAQACPNRAILFGDIRNPGHAVHRILFRDSSPTPPEMAALFGAEAGRYDARPGGAAYAGAMSKLHPHAFRLLERLGPFPQVFYLSRREWVRQQGDNRLSTERG